MRLARSQHVSRGKCSTYRSWSRTNHNNPFIVSFYIFTNRSPWPLHRHRAWQHSLKSVFHEVGPKSKSRLTKCVQHRQSAHQAKCIVDWFSMSDNILPVMSIPSASFWTVAACGNFGHRLPGNLYTLCPPSDHRFLRDWWLYSRFLTITG